MEVLFHLNQTGEIIMTLRLKIWELLVYPAHVWMWIISRMLGYTFEYGAVDHPDDELE